MRYPIFLTLFILPILGFSQPFIYIDAGLDGAIHSSSAWVDYNKDGHLDIIISGEKYSGYDQLINTKMYKNVQMHSFGRTYPGFVNVYRSAMAWGDVDKDGDLDMIICGETHNNVIVTKLYKNNGHGGFWDAKADIVAVRDGSVDFGDFDNDGDLDLLITGETYGMNPVTKIYQNNGKGLFEELPTGLPQVKNSSAKWGDKDSDDDLDILIIGETSKRRLIAKVFRNEGNKTFKEIHLPMPGVRMGDAEWTDFNNDENIDFIYCGETYGNKMITKVFKSTSSGRFIEVESGIYGVRSGNIDIGDYDCDGDPDVLINGENYAEAITKIYKNNGDLQFEDVYANLPGIYLGQAQWADYDGDCDLDVLLVGLDNCFDIDAKLYRNEMEVTPVVVETQPTEALGFAPIVYTERKSPYYYFVFSSCYCYPDGRKAKLQDYNAFVSNVHYSNYPWDLHNRFDAIIIDNLKVWPTIDGGHRVSIGYVTKQEAEKARQTVINSYTRDGFDVNFVYW